MAESLRRMALGRNGLTLTRLSGGVSCDVWKVERPGASPLVVKHALAKLRVAADWRAPPARAKAEVDWFRLVETILPGQVPHVVADDLAHDSFAMEYLEPASHPLWKAELAAGRIDVGFAGRVGGDLAKIHAATAGRADIARTFDNGPQFHALRIEPYLLFTAGRHADLAPRIQAIAAGIACARIALMQGDISPKNILIGPEGPVFLDAETACYGDPAFDAAFCLNHLLLKCVWHPEFMPAYLESFRAWKSAYLKGADWEEKRGLEARIAAILGVFLLARVDGKSPVEYLTEPADKEFVRQTARGFIAREESSLETMAKEWGGKLAV
ncbi:MAG TPA: aminoglycoside phosphotransferase family protein [Rhizomicrobium sp.]|nr:aminoglycoside phosphotransferase family protein [Rhizomicrobium sp.]